MYFSIYILALFISYKASKNIFAPLFIFSMFAFPATMSAKPYVAEILVIGVLCLNIGGYMIAKIIVRDIKCSTIKYQKSMIKSGYRENRFLLIGFIIYCFTAIVISSYYFSKVGISLFADEVGLARLTARHNVSGSYIFQRFFRVLLPIMCIFYYLLQFNSDTRKYYKTFILVALILITSSLLVFTGLRGNLITFMFTPFLIATGLATEKTGTKSILMLFLLALLGGVLITKLMYGDIQLVDIFFLIVARLSGAATDGIEYSVYSDIPRHGYYFGQTYLDDLLSMASKLKIIDSDAMNYSAYTASKLLGSRYNGEAAAIYFAGELYANFSIIGVIIGSLIMGAIVNYFYIKTLIMPKTIIRLSFMAYFLGVLTIILGGPSLSMFIDYSITVGGFMLGMKVLGSFYTLIENKMS